MKKSLTIINGGKMNDGSNTAVRIGVMETELKNQGKELAKQGDTLSAMSEIICKQAEMTQQIVNTNDRITDLQTNTNKDFKSMNDTMSGIGKEVHSTKEIVMKAVGGLKAISVISLIAGIIFGLIKLLKG